MNSEVITKNQAPSQKFFTLNQHNDTAKHRANLEKFLKQEFLAASDLDPFAIELCNALIAANIPLNVLQNETFNKFLQKYCKRSIPCQKDLESVHLPRLYEQVATQTLSNNFIFKFQSFSRIRAELDGHFLYVSVDETTDKLGRVVGNLLVGKLDGMKSYNPYLVSVKVLENVDSNSISRFVNDGLGLFQFEFTITFFFILSFSRSESGQSAFASYRLCKLHDQSCRAFAYILPTITAFYVCCAWYQQDM